MEYDEKYNEFFNWPITNDLCARMASEDEVEYTLDRMLDFCSDEKMLLLFKKICRKYYRIYPEMIARHGGVNWINKKEYMF